MEEFEKKYKALLKKYKVRTSLLVVVVDVNEEGSLKGCITTGNLHEAVQAFLALLPENEKLQHFFSDILKVFGIHATMMKAPVSGFTSVSKIHET